MVGSVVTRCVKFRPCNKEYTFDTNPKSPDNFIHAYSYFTGDFGLSNYV